MTSEQMPGSTPMPRRRHARDTSPDAPRERLYTVPVQRVAAATAVVFGLIGLLGFLPGFTSRIGALEFAGHHSGALLFGVFTVSVLHNVVHLLFAVTGLAFATSSRSARGFLIWGGVIYLLLALYGALVGDASAANFVPVNSADDWLHLGLGVAMIVLGLVAATDRSPRRREANQDPGADPTRG